MKAALCMMALIGFIALAQDAKLAELRAELEQLRAPRQEHPREEHRDTRGATAELIAIKHGLREWAEARLATFPETGEEDALNREFQEAMGAAGLTCPDGCSENALGYADPVRVHREREFLTVQTSVGIACGYDDSAYLYAWRRGEWQRIFETEQNNYTKTGYLPQTIYSVQVSPPAENGDRVVLSLGSRPGCASAFQPLYYRIWRISPRDERPRLLLDASETAYMGDYPPARAIVTSDDVRIEFTAGGTGYGSGHQAVRHFEIRGGSVKQMEPIGPTPRDFVEEWLNAPWNQSVRWSEAAALQQWHFRLHRSDGMGDFPDPPLKCSDSQESNDKDLWQIGIKMHGVEGEMYYLVRWTPPDHFTMAGIADHALCK